jgi:hypothetical protein
MEGGREEKQKEQESNEGRREMVPQTFYSRPPSYSNPYISDDTSVHISYICKPEKALTETKSTQRK